MSPGTRTLILTAMLAVSLLMNGCTVGPRSVVLYDSSLEEGSALDGLSLVMKGESLPAGTSWRGVPARLVE